MIIGVSGFRHKRRTRPFSVYEECTQLFFGTGTDGLSFLLCIIIHSYKFVASRTHRRWCRDSGPDINTVGWEPGWEAAL